MRLLAADLCGGADTAPAGEDIRLRGEIKMAVGRFLPGVFLSGLNLRS